MTTPSHTELAAQARRAAKSLEILDMENTAELMRQCAAALETPERGLGKCHKNRNDYCKCSRAAMLCDGVGSTPPTAPAQDAQGIPLDDVLSTIGLAHDASLDGAHATCRQLLLDALSSLKSLSATPSPQAERVPLSPSRLAERLEGVDYTPSDRRAFIDGVRFAETYHGIVTKESSNG